mmetsp:Transcript_37920/g.95258  ORF Transcript_37920/g.95258 Transcript_37920/m.95258 type:complete len:96 (+) Transcript_37920:488-775(+)
MSAIHVRSIAHAQFEYDDDDKWVRTIYYKHHGFGTGKELARRGKKAADGKIRGGIESMWEGGQEPSAWTGASMVQRATATVWRWARCTDALAHPW